MNRASYDLALGMLLVPLSASAGPPFLTDDPEPIDTGHWEIYPPRFEAEGSGADFDGAFGAEIIYGAAANLQLTLDLPLALTHCSAGWHSGANDLAASVKYRFFQNEAAGLQIAAFPAVTLPTASRGLGAGKVTAFLPVWAQEDMRLWSVFGGGCAVNPGSGNRDYWSGGIAATRQLGKRRLLLRRGRPAGSRYRRWACLDQSRAGAIVELGGRFHLLASGGPTWTDGGGSGFHAFAALGLDF